MVYNDVYLILLVRWTIMMHTNNENWLDRLSSKQVDERDGAIVDLRVMLMKALHAAIPGRHGS